MNSQSERDETKFNSVTRLKSSEYNKDSSLGGHVLTGNECYTINIVGVIVFVTGVDNEC